MSIPVFMNAFKYLIKTRNHIWPSGFYNNAICARCKKSAQEMLDIIFETYYWEFPLEKTCNEYYACVTPNELLMIEANE